MKNHLSYLFTFIFVLSIFYANCQDFNEYKEVKSRGNVPDDFITLLSDKYKSDQELISKRDKWRIRKSKRKFYLESNYHIKDIITSGNVLFNDTLTNYLNSIYRNIKEGNESLQDSYIRFYTSKSTIVNAFTTHAGIIFVNIGLLAKVETEDELAYIMCHEIAHYIEKHNIKQYIYNVEVDTESGTYSESDWETKMFSKANYSQAHEEYADSLGLELFANTNYSISSAIASLENLKTHNLPFNSKMKFSKSYFEGEFISFKEGSVKKLDSIEVKKDNNEFSTHPEIDDRIERLSNFIGKGIGEDPKGRIINKVQKIAQFELCHLFLEKGMYSHSIYCTLSLLEEDKSNKYLNSILCKNFYAFSQGETFRRKYRDKSLNNEYKNNRAEYYEFLSYCAKEVQQISSLLAFTSTDKLNSLAIVSLWGYIKEYPESSVMKLRLKGLLHEYNNYFNEECSNPDHTIYKLRQNDNAFQLFEEHFINDTIVSPLVKDNSKLIIISPEYLKFDLRKRESFKYIASEKSHNEYYNKILDNAELLNYECSLLAPNRNNYTDAETINDFALLKAFLDENYYDTPNTLSSKREQIDELIKKYGTSRLALLASYSFHLKKPPGMTVLVLLWTGVVLPTFPFGLWYAFSPKYKTYNYAAVYNLSTEKRIFNDVHSIRMKDNNAALNSSLYYFLMQIKNIDDEN